MGDDGGKGLASGFAGGLGELLADGGLAFAGQGFERLVEDEETFGGEDDAVGSKSGFFADAEDAFVEEEVKGAAVETVEAVELFGAVVGDFAGGFGLLVDH